MIAYRVDPRALGGPTWTETDDLGARSWFDLGLFFKAPSLSPQPQLHRSVNSSRFLGFLLWFVLGPGGLREAPGGPGKAHGWLWGASRGPPDTPGPGSKNLKTHTFCRARLSGRVTPLETCVGRPMGRDGFGRRGHRSEPIWARWPDVSIHFLPILGRPGNPPRWLGDFVSGP